MRAHVFHILRSRFARHQVESSNALFHLKVNWFFAPKLLPKWPALIFCEPMHFSDKEHRSDPYWASANFGSFWQQQRWWWGVCTFGDAAENWEMNEWRSHERGATEHGEDCPPELYFLYPVYCTGEFWCTSIHLYMSTEWYYLYPVYCTGDILQFICTWVQSSLYFLIPVYYTAGEFGVLQFSCT